MITRECSIEGCAKLHHARGLCKAHCQRAARHRELPPLQRPIRGGCTVAKCDKAHKAGGLCRTHYSRLRRGIDLLTPVRTSPGALPAFIEEAIRYEGDGCLSWPFSVQSGGYGELTYGNRMINAHRLVCELVYGPPPSPEFQAAHSCRNRACVAPYHLRWDTGKGNQSDRLKDGTHSRGSKNPKAKLDESEVRAIRAQPTLVTSALAVKYGVTTKTIRCIRKRTAWVWLKE